ncbi:hypothetical protein [Baekduia alba]|nr:hypothetical protein [Baekduia alba]
MRLAVDPARLHFFDLESGVAIGGPLGGEGERDDGGARARAQLSGASA